MKQQLHHVPAQQSREGARVWFLVVLISVIAMALLGLAVSNSMAASVQMFDRPPASQDAK